MDGHSNERNAHRHDRRRLDEGGTSSDVAQAFQASQLFWNCALASSRVATLSERVIGGSTVSDQNQRKWWDRPGSHRCGRHPSRL